MKKMGTLILLVNDLEDIAVENKHKAGSDIGRKVSFPWGEFYNMQLGENDEYYADLDYDKATVVEGFNAIGSKRRNGEALNSEEAAIFSRILGIGRKYLGRIVNSAETKIRTVYEEAKSALSRAVQILPKNESGVLDEKNQLYIQFFNDYLDRLWSQVSLIT